MTTLTIPARFNGPASSGNGGWTAGALAASARSVAGWAGDVTVQLRRPPPLERPLQVVRTGDVVELRDRDEVVAVAERAAELTWAPPAAVDLDVARSAEDTYAGHRSHPFPRCFSCGPERDDGLRIFPGQVGDGRVAATWNPRADLTESGADNGLDNGGVTEAVTWAALDCVGGWSSDLEDRPLVLAQMCARVGSPPQAGTSYVVVGVRVRTEGRKTWTASAMYADGELVAQAQHLWIAIDPSVVRSLQG